MRNTARSVVWVPIVMLIVAPTGCRTADEFLPPVIEQTPLEHDPTNAIELSTWWSNGREMLHLHPDGRFALHGDQNRYHAPLRVGKWSRPSYAWVRLESYERLGSAVVRAQVSRENGEAIVVVPELAPMRAIRRAPLVLEDALLGEWDGPSGRLRLTEDGQYAFVPAPGTLDRPSTTPGHRGAWSVSDDIIQLAPNPLNMRPWGVSIDVESETIVLRMNGTKMTRGDGAP